MSAESKQPTTSSAVDVGDATKKRKGNEVPPEPSSSPPKKTTKTSSVGNHFTELWFNDGNIVITTQHDAFKIHAGFVSTHSRILRNKVNEVMSATTQERYDGCPVLRLTKETGDFTRLLLVIYRGLIFERISKIYGF